MVNITEKDEREYLEVIKEKLLLAVRRVDENVRSHAEELRQKKQYMYEHQSGMDEADMVAAGQSIDRMAFTGESAVARKRRLMKLSESPYFGRIDFVPRDSPEDNTIYIGIYSFLDETSRTNLIYDWRAPVSSRLATLYRSIPRNCPASSTALRPMTSAQEGKPGSRRSLE